MALIASGLQEEIMHAQNQISAVPHNLQIVEGLVFEAYHSLRGSALQTQNPVSGRFELKGNSGARL